MPISNLMSRVISYDFGIIHLADLLKQRNADFVGDEAVYVVKYNEILVSVIQPHIYAQGGCVAVKYNMLPVLSCVQLDIILCHVSFTQAAKTANHQKRNLTSSEGVHISFKSAVCLNYHIFSFSFSFSV